MAESSEKKGGGRTRLILALTCLVALGALVWGWIFPEARPDIKNAQASTNAALATDQVADLDEIIPIYIVGAVVKPGIYKIVRGSYLYELVELAGGLLETAAADSINLAMRLDENQLIRIPTRAEVAADPNAAALAGVGSSSTKLINLNKADATELDLLPGVGPSTAKAILEYRKKNGSFQCIEDLMKVPGIKESRFNSIKDLICCS